jgi:hypothetical protein
MLLGVENQVWVKKLLPLTRTSTGASEVNPEYVGKEQVKSSPPAITGDSVFE